MVLELKRHPDSRSSEVAKIIVNAARVGRPGCLLLSYALSGSMGGIHLPRPIFPARTDELWKHTCFEAFVGVQQGEAYCEFNFSPSTQWAAYRFKRYREGMRPIEEIAAPAIDAHVAEGFELLAVLDLSGVPELPPDRPWRIGLSAVIEQIDGEKSFWALAHPQGKPDFHHADGFVLDLPAGPL